MTRLNIECHLVSDLFAGFDLAFQAWQCYGIPSDIQVEMRHLVVTVATLADDVYDIRGRYSLAQDTHDELFKVCERLGELRRTELVDLIF